jgi:dipeptidyl aminopeptidase/acylaminoacyl peptidase/murein tripeptide amidase MpaA
MFRRIAFVVVSLVVCSAFSQAQAPPQTVAETSQYQATSHYADVMDFCTQLSKLAPNVVRLSDIGTSGEGRKIPLLILADPFITTPEQAASSGKLVAFLQGNIHAGEVDGKEALLMLAREIALAKERPLLKDWIIAIAPIVNPDGNERFSKAHRTEQNGPPEVGIRENASGFDLNRDFIKLETPEGQAMVRFYRRWNPAVVIDTHTTNGSQHRYPLTYDGPRHPATFEPLRLFVQDNLLPAAGKKLEKATGFPSFFYGNFDPTRTRWEAYPAMPRMGTPYVGLRGRIEILSESYSYAPFKDRVTASREFARACLEALAENTKKVRELLDGAKKPAETVAIQHELAARPKPVTVLGYEEEANRKPLLDKPKEYTVTHIDQGEATLTVTRPYAYLIPAEFSDVMQNLLRHGVNVQELREDIELDYEPETVQTISRGSRDYQKHRLLQLKTATEPAKSRRFPAGTALVRTDQPLARLIVILLEARSEDGLAAWGFLGDQLKEGQPYPIVRLTKEVPMTIGKVRPLAEDRTMNKRVTPEDYLANRVPSFGGFPVRNLEWLDDGEHFLQVKNNKLYKIQAVTGRAQPLVDAVKLKTALSYSPSLDAKAIGRIIDSTTFEMNPQKTGFLFTHADDLYYASFDGSKALRLTRNPAKKELATFSPDGQWVAFVREQNLYVVDLATQAERKLTTDGGGKVSNGKADWVYYEEINNRDWHAYWWSPDSRNIAFLRIDDTPVNTFTVIDEIPVRQKLEPTPYPKAGDPNPLVKLGIVSVAGGDPQFPDLNGYTASSILLPRACWPKDGKSVVYFVQDRAQTWLDVCSDSVNGGAPKRLFRETTKAWVDDPGELTFLRDGSFLFPSERTGWRHLYLYDKTGKLIRQVTSGDWEVRHVHSVDEDGGWIYFSGTKDSPIALNLYRVRLDGSSSERLTPASGDHHINLSTTCSYFVDSRSSHESPTQVRLFSRDGKQVRTIDSNPTYAREEYGFGQFQQVQIPMKDGFQLEGSILLPVDFDPAKKYPVWFRTYAGPHTPTIVDAWNNRVSDHVLSGLGIVVFRCDPRSASGKGAISAWSSYRQLGVQELKDIEEAIDWLIAKHPYVDAAKIGMDGHSYGGFMTSFAMTHSKKFCAGIAGAPVTDWKNYDTIYTERYMNTPQENPEGYRKTSVVRAAANLHGRLLLAHGLIDDNVHMQNSMQFVNELQKAGKDFELMIYPHSRHGIFEKHYQRLMLEFIRKSLGK